MEYIAFVLIIGGIVLFLFINESFNEKKREKALKDKLMYHYGEVTPREYSLDRYQNLSKFYEKHKQDRYVDDITFKDLGMDDVFLAMNDTYSSAGEEVLYALLRTPQFDKEELFRREELISYFMEHPSERVSLQLLFNKLGYTGKYSLYDYLDYLDRLGKRSNLKHHICNMLYIPATVIAFFRPSMGIFLVVGLMIYGMITYFKEKSEIDPYIISFSYIFRLIKTAEKMEGLKLEEIKKEVFLLSFYRKKFASFKRGSFWLMSTARMSGSGNPIDMLLDYFRMVFHLDLIKFNSMLSELRKHTEDADMLFSIIGYLESMISIGAYRKKHEGEYCVPILENTDEEALHYLKAEELYHPLIQHPVKNNIFTENSILITGSNASGKSTFLKTVAINAIFAQTIHTVLAKSYEGVYFEVCSSMALRDNLEKGESYYIVEIKSIKRILDKVGAGHNVLCFVDEVLRGTNTVERIAASTEILKSLSGTNILCFAATHDVELTELLKQQYENYHFEEEIVDNDVRFHYHLLSGKATTRNAIKLLGVMGYEEEIIENANRRAEIFMQTGQWNK